jgi:KaiC/GvpD/RAD55 family RecA-like ATPase
MEYVIPTETKPVHEESPTESFDIFDLRIGEAPALIDHIYSLASRINDPIILIDSWDAIASKLSSESKEKIEDWLEVLITKMDATLILVNEEFKQTKMDYLADGVVTLSKTRLDERLIRELELNKLRGVRIDATKYVFTLEDGRFRHFEPWQWQTIPQKERLLPPTQENTNLETISTGIYGLDKLLSGGWEKGSVNLFEIGAGVGNDFFALIVPPAVSYISQGGAFTGVSNGLDLKYLHNALPQLTKQVEERLHIVHLSKTPLPKKHHLKNRVHVDSSNPINATKALETTLMQAKSPTKQSRDAISMGYLDATVLERELGPELTIEILSKATDLIANTSTVNLVTIRDSQKTLEDVRPLASTHWKLRRKHGSLLFYGIVPQTGAYVIETSLENQYLETTIIPIL